MVGVGGSNPLATTRYKRMPLYAAFFVSDICDENLREVVLKKSQGAIFNSEAGP